MNSREIIKRVIEFDHPNRIGLRLKAEGCPKDILSIEAPQGNHRLYRSTDWSSSGELLNRVPGFAGQVRQDAFGNVWGRLDATSKGECVKGALQDGWEALLSYELPTVDEAAFAAVRAAAGQNPHRYRMGMLPGMPFSLMRVMRGMENFLLDVLLNESEVLTLRDRCMDYLLGIVDGFAQSGMDGIFVGEDWGTQTSLLISPTVWRRIFQPCFAQVADRCHSQGMHFLVHSCGFIWDIIEDLIASGVNALQLDQPQLMGVERLNEAFGGRVTFFCPVDIQRVMPTGDRALIEAEARRMIQTFGSHGGGLIACDYSDWPSLGIKDEWAGWARKVFMEEGIY
jgi:uroporphyrinogen decarboxylase